MTPRDVATVFVVGDDLSFSQSVAALAKANDLLCESIRSARELLRACGERAGCLVVDKATIDLDVVEFLDEARRRGAPSMVLVSQRPAVRCIVNAVRLGVYMMVDKPWSDEELLRSIREAIEDDVQNRERRAKIADLRKRALLLTDSERRVMQMIVGGETNKAIAGDLNTSLRTVESRRQNVFTKLGVRSVAELVRAALLVEQPHDPILRPPPLDGEGATSTGAWPERRR